MQRTIVVAAAGLSLVVASSAALAQDAPPPQPGNPPYDPRSQQPSPYLSPYPYSPYPYGYRLPPEERPEVIEYDEGKPIPLGYTQARQNRRALVITGTVLLSVAYGLSFMGATVAVLDGEGEAAPMFLPVLGPFITLGANENMAGAMKFIFLLDGLTQLAGAAMIVTGVAWKKDVLLREGTIKNEAFVPEFLIGPGSAGVRMRF